MKQRTKTTRRETKDKRFKNAVLDYALPALRFLAPRECEDLPDDATILPVRQEQLVGKLDLPFRATDVPLQVRLPGGQREAFLVLVEEESRPRAFDILRLVEYTVGASRLLKTRRIVPVVLFVGAGRAEDRLVIGTEREAFLTFEYVVLRLSSLKARDYWHTMNPFVALNLVNMQHDRSEHEEVCRQSVDRFFELEQDRARRQKYYRFIEAEARLPGRQRVELQTWVTTQSRWRSQMRSSFDDVRDEGRKEGRTEGASAALLAVIQARHLKPTKAQRSLIETCTDAGRLKRWVKRAATARDVDEIFASRGAR